MTGTVRPGQVPDLKRKEFKVRENDYVQSIHQWTKLGIKIVFCENSNTLSDRIVNVLQNSLIKYEYLSFPTACSHLGKGHGEAEIFKYAFKNSVILAESDYIIKVTGRYFVKNSLDIINKFIEADNLSICANVSSHLQKADSRFFLFRSEFYNNSLYFFFEKLDESNRIFFEHILAKSILNFVSNGSNWAPLFYYPIYKGVYGTLDKKYSNSRFKIFIKSIKYKVINWAYAQKI